MNALSQRERAWRNDIDAIIEKKLESAGFQQFDGNSYSFPISDDVLGVVQIYNQELFKRPDPRRAIINTRLGIIDYQLNELEGQLEQGPNYRDRMWQWTLGGAYRHSAGVFIEMFDLYKSQPLIEKEAAIDDLVRRIQREAVPVLRKKFKTLPDIADYLRKERYPDEQLYCIALAASGSVTEASARANSISANMDISRVNKIAWPEFKPKFDKWIADGAIVPNLAAARSNTLKAAEMRRKILSTIPADERPVW